MNFKSKIKPQNPDKKQTKKDILKSLYALFDGRKRVFDTFDRKIFPMKTECTGFLDRTGDKVTDH